MKKTYSQKLRDPRWQKKRLEIMERDDFTCLACQSKDKTLNVHHGIYEKDKEPWEYDEMTLHTYCEDCHIKRQFIEGLFKEVIAKLDHMDLMRYLFGIACDQSHTISGLAKVFNVLKIMPSNEGSSEK